MEKNFKKDMARLKKDLYEKKEKIQDIRKLVNKEIDRELPIRLEEFSEKELEARMNEQLSYLDEAVNPFPEKTQVTSHRKIIGKPIVWLKRFLLRSTNVYITLILDKQRKFNQRCVALCQTLILHQKKYRKKINQIEERISENELRLDGLTKKLEELDANGKQNAENKK